MNRHWILIWVLLMFACWLPSQLLASEQSPYAGQESREIKALSEEDVAELRRGGGWGLALPAELNGVPGPLHLLELSEEVSLSADQLAEIEAHRSELRYVHLSAHLDAAEVITDTQVSQYNQLRGYSGSDCDNVPEGHDPAMWRMHHGCE